MKKHLIFACLLLGAARPAAAEADSKLKVDIYGFIKTDLIYSDHGTSNNELRTYASGGRGDRAFRASARASRIGFNISNGANVAGKIEADFQGLTNSLAGTAGPVTDLRLRHAYATVTAGKTEFLAGQTYYPITADIPDTLGDYSMGHSGVLYSRAPQLRATYKPVEKLKFIAAVTRPTSKLTDAEGTHSALPGLQGKIEKELGKATVSLAGAAGTWKSTTTQKTADVSAVVAAFAVPYSLFTLSGEAWLGRNLADFLGGLGNMGYGDKAVSSKGGYLALRFKPKDALWFNLIYGVDDPDNSKVAATDRTRNATALVNAVVRVYDCVETGFEVSELETRYKDLPARAAMSYHFSVKLIF